jgi:hypothetical protein
VSLRDTRRSAFLHPASSATGRRRAWPDGVLAARSPQPTRLPEFGDYQADGADVGEPPAAICKARFVASM